MKHELGRPCLLPVCLVGCVETSWSLTQQVAGSNKHFYKNVFIELNKFTEYIGKTQMTQHNYRPQRSCEGYVFTGVCLSTGGVCIPACIAGGYPSMPCSRSPEGGVYPSMHCRRVPACPAQGGGVPSMHCSTHPYMPLCILIHPRMNFCSVQVSGPHPRGKPRGFRSRPTPKGEIEGDSASRPTPRGKWIQC